MPKGKSYLTRFDEAFKDIGDVDSDTAPPRYNDMRSRITAEFSIATRLRTLANRRYEGAKVQFINQFNTELDAIKPGNGKSGILSNTYCSVTAHKREGQSRVDRKLLINKLVVDHNMTLDEATKLADSCSKKDNDALMLEANIFDKADR